LPAGFVFNVPYCDRRANISRSYPVAERAGWPPLVKRPHLRVMMLDLSDQQSDALAGLLRQTIDDDRHPLSPRVQTLKAILAKIQPEPTRDPLPTPKRCAPRATMARRRHSGH
jgi:hypothetical protein